MVSLKKFFMEGLIQVAILLSLCRVQEEVGPGLSLPPSLQEILLGHASALTPAQSRRLHHHGLHPKTVDLDGFFTARRLLGFGRSLDGLQVPQVELETWLVQRDPGPRTLPRGSPYQTSPLERPAAGTRGTHTPPGLELQVGHVDQEEEEEEEEQVVRHDGPEVHRGEGLSRRSSSEGGGGPGGSSGHVNPENQADQVRVSVMSHSKVQSVKKELKLSSQSSLLSIGRDEVSAESETGAGRLPVHQNRLELVTLPNSWTARRLPHKEMY